MSDPTTPPSPDDNKGGSSVPPPPANYGGSAPPPPAYGAPGGGYAMAQPHPQGTLILVLGILSIFCCGIILGPAAIIMANNAQRDMAGNPGAYSNAGMIQAGKILGIIGTVLWILTVIFYGVTFAIAGSQGFNSGY